MKQATLHYNNANDYYIMREDNIYTLDETNAGKIFADKLQGVTKVFYNQRELIKKDKKIRQSFLNAGVELRPVFDISDEPVPENNISIVNPRRTNKPFSNRLLHLLLFRI